MADVGSREWGDLPPGSAASELPYAHRRTLDIIVNHYGGNINPVLGDVFIASLSRPALRDLAQAGYLRHRWAGYEATLAGRQALLAGRSAPRGPAAGVIRAL